MKKVFTVFVCLMAAGAAMYAQIRPNPGIPNDPVDYSRLRMPTDEPTKIAIYTMELEKFSDNETTQDLMKLDFGKTVASNVIHIMGEVVHTWNITPEYVERCIQNALRVSKIGTRAELARLKKYTDLFKDYEFGGKELAQDLYGIATGAISIIIPAEGMASFAYGTITSVAGTAMDIATDNASMMTVAGAESTAISVANQAGKLTGLESFNGGYGKFLTYAQLFDIMKKAYERDQQRYDNAVALLNLRRIDYFYHLVNQYLRDGATNYERVWIIDFPTSSETLPFVFRGEKCKVTWTIEGAALKLKSIPPKINVPQSDFEGEYYGAITATANFDLSNYDKHYDGHQSMLNQLGMDEQNPNYTAVGAVRGIRTWTDEARHLYNYYKASPMYEVAALNNSATSLSIKYNSPMTIKVEMPTDWDKLSLDTYPADFWEAYEHKESLADMDAVIRAMGLKENLKDSYVKVDWKLYKSFRAMEKPSGPRMMISESVNNGKYIFNNTGEENTMSAKEALNRAGDSNYIPTEIPYATVHILWNIDVTRDKRSARDMAEQQWAPLFEKFAITAYPL